MRSPISRRHLFTVLALVLAIPIACWAVAFIDEAKKDRAMRAKFDQIQPGMTLAEVEVLFGRPFDGQNGGRGDLPHVRTIKGWNGPGSLTTDIWLDSSGLVCGKEIHKTSDITPWQRARLSARYWLERHGVRL
jgi:hypothetical protein